MRLRRRALPWARDSNEGQHAVDLQSSELRLDDGSKSGLICPRSIGGGAGENEYQQRGQRTASMRLGLRVRRKDRSRRFSRVLMRYRFVGSRTFQFRFFQFRKHWVFERFCRARGF